MTNPPAEPTSARRRGVWRRFGRGPVVAAAAIAALIAIGATGNVGQTYALWSDTAATKPQVATAGSVKTTAVLAPSTDTVYTGSSLTKVRALTVSNTGTVASTLSTTIALATGTSSIPASSVAVDAFQVSSAAICASQTGTDAVGTWLDAAGAMSGSIAPGAQTVYCIRTTLKDTKGLSTNHTLNATIATTLKTSTWTSSVNTTLAQSVGDVVAPATPSGVIGTAVTDSSISIAWNASTDNVAVTGYEVYQNGVWIGTTPATTRTFTHTGLSSATAQSYTVKAKDAAGNMSAASTTLGVTSFNSAPRYQIQNSKSGKCLNVKLESTQTLQQWTCGPLGTTNESWKFTPGTNGLYTVSPLSHPANSWDVNNNSTSESASVILWSTTNAANQLWRIVPLPDGKFQFVASHSGRCLDVRDASVVDGAILQQYTCSRTNMAQAFALRPVAAVAPVPGAPTSLSVTKVESTSISLSWTAPSNTAGLTGYVVYRDGNRLPTEPTARTFVDTGLSPGTTYRYEVRAKNTAGLSEPSNAITPRTTSPTVPQLDCRTHSDRSYVQLSWPNPSTSGTYLVLVNGKQTSIDQGNPGWPNLILTAANIPNATTGNHSVEVKLVQQGGTLASMGTRTVTVHGPDAAGYRMISCL